MSKELLSVYDLCNELNIGRTTAYNMIKKKTIPSVRIGKKILISKRDIDTFLRNLRN